MLSITVAARNDSETLTSLRKGGQVPAVFYGKKEKATSIAVPQKDFLKVWKEAGESSIISLKGAGADEKQVLIHDVSQDPVTGLPIHVDFYAIEKDKKLEVSVPIEFTGVSGAVKDLGGILVKVLHELEIESLPKDLPHNVTVDIGSLATLDSQILAKDIALPTGVTLITGPEEVVAAITEAKEEEEESKPIDLESIEVEKKGKEAAEGEEGTEASDTEKKE